jgi:hypothetical protein
MRPEYNDHLTYGWRAKLEQVLPALREEVGAITDVASLLRRFFPATSKDMSLDNMAQDEPTDHKLLELAEQRKFDSLLAHCLRSEADKDDADQATLMKSCIAKSRSKCWLFLRTSQTTIDDRTTITQLKLRYNLDTLVSAGLCTCHAHGGKVKGEKSWSDAKGHHAISCPIGGFRSGWHDDTVAVNVSSCLSVGLKAVVEPKYNINGTKIPSSKRRGDIHIPVDPLEHDGPCFLDHVVTNTTQGVARGLTHTPTGVKAALKAAEDRKRRNFPNELRADYNIHPIAFLIVGDAVGDTAEAWFETLEKRARTRAGDAAKPRVSLRLKCRLEIIKGVGAFLESKNKELRIQGSKHSSDQQAHDMATSIEATMLARARIPKRVQPPVPTHVAVLKHRHNMMLQRANNPLHTPILRPPDPSVRDRERTNPNISTNPVDLANIHNVVTSHATSAPINHAVQQRSSTQKSSAKAAELISAIADCCYAYHEAVLRHTRHQRTTCPSKPPGGSE